MPPLLRAAVLLGCAALACPAAIASDATFSIRDRLALDEVAEVTTVYVDDTMVRSFRLDADHRDITIPVTVPDPEIPHRYTLCGHILVREQDGSVRTQPFAIAGEIADVDGRAFEAYASDNFTRFFLLDRTKGRPPTKIAVTATDVCTPAVS